MNIVKTLIIGTLLLSTTQIFATSVFYSIAGNFLDNVSNLQFDSFEDLPRQTNSPVNSLERGEYSVSGSYFNPPVPNGESFGLYVYDFAAGFGAYATDGENYIVHQTDSGESLTFLFDTPVTAFAFTITDWESPTGNDASLVFQNNLGEQYTIATGPLPPSNEIFFGVISDVPFSELVFLNTSPVEAYGFDSVYFSATVVPIPGALVLMLGSLLTFVGFKFNPPQLNTAS